MIAWAWVSLPLCAQAAVPAPRSGGFELGVGVEPLEVGGYQAFSRAGQTSGVVLGPAVQIDLGPRLALRVPVRVHAGGAYLDLEVAPGLVYRFRSSADQLLIPYLGAALRLSSLTVDKALLGLPVAPGGPSPSCGDGDADDPPCTADDGVHISKVGGGVELRAGLELHPGRYVSFVLNLSYGYQQIAAVGVHSLQETLSLRLTF